MFFGSRAGNGTIAITVATILLAWPPAMSWILAVYLILWGSDQLRQAFKDADRHEPIPTTVVVETAAPSPQPVQREGRAADLGGISIVL